VEAKKTDQKKKKNRKKYLKKKKKQVKEKKRKTETSKSEDEDYTPSITISGESDLRRSTRKRKNLNLYVIDDQEKREKKIKTTDKIDPPTVKKKGIHGLSDIQKSKKPKKTIEDKTIESILKENPVSEENNKNFNLSAARNALEEAIMKTFNSNQKNFYGKINGNRSTYSSRGIIGY